MSQQCIWQITAGMVLGEPDPKFSRRYEVTSAEWEASTDKMLLTLSRWHEAVAYATQLQVNSSCGLEPNWVHINYIWM